MRIRYPNLFASMEDETEGTIPILSFLVLYYAWNRVCLCPASSFGDELRLYASQFGLQYRPWFRCVDNPEAINPMPIWHVNYLRSMWIHSSLNLDHRGPLTQGRVENYFDWLSLSGHYNLCQLLSTMTLCICRIRKPTMCQMIGIRFIFPPIPIWLKSDTRARSYGLSKWYVSPNQSPMATGKHRQ